MQSGVGGEHRGVADLGAVVDEARAVRRRDDPARFHHQQIGGGEVPVALRIQRYGGVVGAGGHQRQAVSDGVQGEEPGARQQFVPAMGVEGAGAGEQAEAIEVGSAADAQTGAA